MFKPEIFIKNLINKLIEYFIKHIEDFFALFLILYLVFFLYSLYTYIFFNFFKKFFKKINIYDKWIIIEDFYKKERRKFFFYLVRPSFFYSIHYLWVYNYIFFYKKYIILILAFLCSFSYLFFLSRYKKRDKTQIRDFLNINVARSYFISLIFDSYLERSLMLRRDILINHLCHNY